ncbi:hypothetical protein ACRALDRAFT_1060033 [Sodiomyces alcalophilus JCM 7366]|uniref:uncharacterized protein n=1 Tax=Sodiomyces alcalophilus JCM 7366 TaxID=591952 RepID=UPI0039B517B0
MTSSLPSCTKCKKSPPEVKLKRCAKCWKSPYCSRDCQKADWKAHKKICRTQEPGSSADSDNPPTSPPKGLDAPVAKPFTRLENGTWLHDRSEKDVYRLLIDAYRLRMEDNYNHEGEADDDSIYGGAPHGLVGFRRFLDLVAERDKLLPPWWDADKRKACEEMGMDRGGGNFYNLAAAVEKGEIIDRYGDQRFPMQLRMFAEAVYLSGPGGADGTRMREMMASMESGEGQGGMTFLSMR